MAEGRAEINGKGEEKISDLDGSAPESTGKLLETLRYIAGCTDVGLPPVIN